MRAQVLFTALLLLLMSQSSVVDAKDDGKFNSASSGCGCHSGASGSVSPVLSGLPTAYDASTTYTLSIGMSTSPASGGFNLQVSKGGLSNPSSAAQVSTNGVQATHNTWTSTSWSVDWTSPVSGSGSVQFNLAVLAGNGMRNTGGDDYATTSVSLSEAVTANQAPSVSSLAFEPTNPTTEDAILVTYTFNDTDGDVESGTTFAWHLNNSLMPSHTTATLPSSATSKHQSWTVEVTPSDGIDSGSTVMSSTLTIANSLPQITNVQLSDTDPDSSTELTFQYLSDDADDDAIDLHVQWKLNGQVVPELDNATTLPAIATRSNDVWSVELRGHDGEGFGAWTPSANVTIASGNTPPVVSQVSLVIPSPTDTTSDLLVQWDEVDGDGDAIVEREIAWTVNGQIIEAAHGMNPLPPAMTTKGEVWKASVRASDGITWSSWEESDTVTIVNAAPIITSIQLNSSSMTVMHDLIANIEHEDADGDTVSITSLRWFNQGQENLAFTNASLEGAALMKGDVWTVEVTVSDGESEVSGTSASATILNAAPSVSLQWPDPITSLNELAPQLLASDPDGDSIEIWTNWYKNGFRNAGLENSTVVPSEKLAPGQTWTMSVLVWDGDTFGERVEDTLVIANLPPTAAFSVLSTEVWFGEEVVLSAADSIDLDGNDLTYTWSWATGSASGSMLTLVPKGVVDVTLVVSDEFGATNSTTQTLQPTVGPYVQNLLIIHDGQGSVELSWSWNGNEAAFNILRGSQLIATVNDTSYSDNPPMSGLNEYTIQPVDQDRIYLNAVESISLTIESPSIEAPEASAAGGYGLGILLLLGSIVLLQRNLSRGGER